MMPPLPLVWPCARSPPLSATSEKPNVPTREPASPEAETRRAERLLAEYRAMIDQTATILRRTRDVLDAHRAARGWPHTTRPT